MTNQDTLAATSNRKLRVWDFPTRLFHRNLLVLLLISWFSGGEEAFTSIHRASGLILAGLIVLRVIWGFAGGEHARFGSFFPSPGKVIHHLKQVAAGNPERRLGHNPLGAIAVILLLGSVAACVLTGLFSSDEALSGPFA